MQFKAFEPGIEVNGQTVYAIVDGFRITKQLPSKILLGEGIGRAGKDGMVEIDPAGWYSQEAWLRAFEQISASLGPHLLESIGHRIPENASFPPWVTDVDSAIKSVDVAYHMNHRKAGKVMFDPAAGTLLEGIGHYGYARPNPAVQKIVSVCENPYPCDFDRGILASMAQRFAKTPYLAHDANAPCRKTGGKSCTYTIEW